MPAVSVVIPTYNRIALLKQTIASVLEQTFTDFELIVVDDGSTDGTLDYLRTIPDPRIRRLELPHTANIAQVRNAGARNATGHFLCFLDSDDLWLPNKLAVQVDRMAGCGMRWSYTGYARADAEGRPFPPPEHWRALSGNVALAVINTEARVALVTVMVEQSLFWQLDGFDEDPLNLREDLEFLIRLAVTANTLGIQESLALVRDHRGRTTKARIGAAPSVAMAYTYEKLLSILTNQDLRRGARRQRAYHLAESGAQYFRAGSLLAAGRCFLRSALDGAEPRHWVRSLLKGIGIVS